MQWTNGDYELTDEPGRLDRDVVCTLLQGTYWAAHRSRKTIEKSLRHSLNFSLFRAGRQVGFARVITDYATHAYLCDVVIAAEHRGQGVGKWMLRCLLDHPELATVRTDLFTRDAGEFYRSFGFAPHRFECLVHYAPGYADGSGATLPP